MFLLPSLIHSLSLCERNQFPLHLPLLSPGSRGSQSGGQKTPKVLFLRILDPGSQGRVSPGRERGGWSLRRVRGCHGGEERGSVSQPKHRSPTWRIIASPAVPQAVPKGTVGFKKGKEGPKWRCRGTGSGDGAGERRGEQESRSYPTIRAGRQAIFSSCKSRDAKMAKECILLQSPSQRALPR